MVVHLTKSDRKESNVGDGTDDNTLWNDSEEHGEVRSEWQKDEGTDCEEGDSVTDWKRYIESDMLCVLSVWN
jgi:hypothetical protein